MKKHIAVLAAATVFALALGLSPTAKAQSLNENIKKSIVFIASYDYKGNLLGRGSGFFIDEGVVVTSSHVIQGEARYYLIAATNDKDSLDTSCYKEINRSDIKVNLNDDVAYIRVYLDCPHGSVYLSDEDPRVGETIGIFGYPSLGESFFSSFDLAYSIGSVLEKTVGGVVPGEVEGPWLRTDAPIHSGNSGGPVVQGGQVVGVAAAAHTDVDGNSIDGLFIPVSEIRRGLEEVNSSALAYTPQRSQKNQAYLLQSDVAVLGGDPFNPITSAGGIASKGDCQASLGEGGEATGYAPQQGDACRCKSSFHRDAAGTKCLPGSPELAEQMKKERRQLQGVLFSDVSDDHPYINAIRVEEINVIKESHRRCTHGGAQLLFIYEAAPLRGCG